MPRRAKTPWGLSRNERILLAIAWYLDQAGWDVLLFGDFERFLQRRGQDASMVQRTVYRAVDRFEDWGLGETVWEDPNITHKPARRGLLLTDEGRKAAIWSIQQLRAEFPPPAWIPIPETAATRRSFRQPEPPVSAVERKARREFNAPPTPAARRASGR